MPVKKTEVLFIRVDVGLANRLRELAAEDDRRLSTYVYRVLKKYVADIGKDGQN